MKCDCEEWAPNIEKVNAPLATAFARNPSTAKQYDGVTFRFCPWCGSALGPEDAGLVRCISSQEIALKANAHRFVIENVAPTREKDGAT